MKMHKGTMRNSLLALAGLSGAVAMSSGAMAADLKTPVFKAPPAGVLPTAYDWTGFYVGAHVGYGFGRSNWHDAAGLNVTDTSNGVLGGAQAGFNYQVGKFVLGVEADGSGSGIRGGTTAMRAANNMPALKATINNDVDWTSTVTGRAGMAFDRWLVYGKGGVAFAGDRFSTNRYTPVIKEVTDTRVGWTVGGGVEYAFAGAWSAKAEYNYMDFGTRAVSFAPGTSTNIGEQVHEVKFGVNYKFGAGPLGPLLARY
jgi:outer membrane immunogenic protein